LHFDGNRELIWKNRKLTYSAMDKPRRQTPVADGKGAAVALIPIIEAGLVDSKISTTRASLMASFCIGDAVGKRAAITEIFL
jgi:hypothetical protein